MTTSRTPSRFRATACHHSPCKWSCYAVGTKHGTLSIKHVTFADGVKVTHTTIRSRAVGRALEIDYQKNYRDGSKASQYEGLGGFQVRYHKMVPGNKSAKLIRQTEDIRKGFQYIQKNGPQDSVKGDFTTWAEEHHKGIPAVSGRFTPEHAIIWIEKSEIGKSPVSYTLAHLMSAFWLVPAERVDQHPSFQTTNHRDYFRNERDRRTKPRVYDDGNIKLARLASIKAVTEVSGVDRKTMARYNASSFEKNQFCQACSNPCDRSAEPPMAANVTSDRVDCENFYKIARPSFHKDFNEEDLIAVFKRSAVVVFTDIAIYFRPLLAPTEIPSSVTVVTLVWCLSVLARNYPPTCAAT